MGYRVFIVVVFTRIMDLSTFYWIVRHKPFYGVTMFMCILATGGAGFTMGLYDSSGK